MTNPDNVGGLPELPEPVLTAYTKADGVTPFWKYDGMVMTHEGRHVGVGGNKSIHLFTADQMRAYGELCRAAPAGGVCDKLRPGAPCQSPDSCRENGCAAVERERYSAPAGSGEVDYDWDATHEALESMDDYARMDKGVAPYGPYSVLRDLLTKAKGWKEEAALLRKLQQGAE